MDFNIKWDQKHRKYAEHLAITFGKSDLMYCSSESVIFFPVIVTVLFNRNWKAHGTKVKAVVKSWAIQGANLFQTTFSFH